MEIKNTIVTTQPLTHREKESIKSKHKHTCVYCGCKNRLLLTVEHKTPLTRGGTNDNNNLVCSCHVCNQIKGGLTHSEFIEYMKHLTGLHKLSKAHIKLERVEVKIALTHHPGLEKG